MMQLREKKIHFHSSQISHIAILITRHKRLTNISFIASQFSVSLTLSNRNDYILKEGCHRDQSFIELHFN